jgi:hypothetical protein
MPDGDKVHGSLRYLYQNPYKILCEGVASDEQCAHGLLKSLRQDLQQKGILPLLLSKEIVDQLSPRINPLLLSNEIEWGRISRDIDERVRRAEGSPNLKALFLRAVKSVFHDVRYGREIDGDMQTCLLKQYIHEVCDSEFNGRVPLNPNHHAGVARETLQKRMEDMQPHVDSGIEKFAQAAIRSQSLDRLSVQQRHLRAEIDLNENLLAS